MTRNSFVVEVTFKDVLRNCSLRIELGRNSQTYMVEIVIWSSRKEKKKICTRWIVFMQLRFHCNIYQSF